MLSFISISNIFIDIGRGFDLLLSNLLSNLSFIDILLHLLLIFFCTLLVQAAVRVVSGFFPDYGMALKATFYAHGIPYVIALAMDINSYDIYISYLSGSNHLWKLIYFLVCSYVISMASYGSEIKDISGEELGFKKGILVALLESVFIVGIAFIFLMLFR